MFFFLDLVDEHDEGFDKDEKEMIKISRTNDDILTRVQQLTFFY